MFPPRERGWSLTASRMADVLAVSPARAGMVPEAGRMDTIAARFPRASGDGPSVRNLAESRPVFPPRERGWSRWDDRHEQDA